MPTHYKTSIVFSSAECLANLPDGVKNLLGIFAQATSLELHNGKQWFPSAHFDAQRVALLYKVDFDTVVRVASAMSPKCEWENNIPVAEFAIRYYQAGEYVPDINLYITGQAYLARTKTGTKKNPNRPVLAEDPRLPSLPGGGLKQNFIKALWILQGHTWVLRGPKVNPFCDNIKHPWTSKLVTIDSHAIWGWFGLLESGTVQVPESYKSIIVADYIKAAQVVGIPALEFQAVVWLVKKRLATRRTKR